MFPITKRQAISERPEMEEAKKVAVYTFIVYEYCLVPRSIHLLFIAEYIAAGGCLY